MEGFWQKFDEALGAVRKFVATKLWQCSLINEERTGNIAKIRLLVNSYRPEIQTELCLFFARENDLNSEKKEVFTNPLLTAMFPVLLPLI